MRRHRDRLIYSPSDLIRFLESPYASFMQRLHLEFPDRVTPDEEDAQLRLVADEGYAHEHAHRDRLVAAGSDVCEIDDTDASAEATRTAITEGREVIYQAKLELDPFAGYADFLMCSDEPGPEGQVLYDVWDTKLARRPRPYYLVQLCAYAEMLAPVQGALPGHVGIVLGDGSRREFRTDDYYFFYLRVKAAFLEQMRTFDPDDRPVPNARADHGRWRSHADAWLESVDHLSRVAGMHRVHLARLEEAGITTMAALAEIDGGFECGIQNLVLDRLRTQARLQVRAAAEPPPAPYEVVAQPGHGLTKLPPASPGDVFLDLEGYPFAEGGLEYLFGCAYVADDGEPAFEDFWGFDAEGEKRAFERCIDWILERWRRDPAMHVYHYAQYEVDAFKRLMGKYATREEEVDHLLRQRVFVDLFRVVYEGFRLGERNYSLKSIEKQYMDREGEVETAGQSIVVFAEWLASGQPGDWALSPILKSIREYNRDDCESTRLLADWLRTHQGPENTLWAPSESVETVADVRPPSEAAQARRDLSERLLGSLPEDPEQDGDDETIQRLLAYLLEFHWREDKPVWWAYYERHDWEGYQHVRDLASIGRIKRKGEPVPVKRSLGFPYRYSPSQDTKVKEGSTVCFTGIFGPEGGPQTFEVVAFDGDAGRLQLKVGPKALAHLGQMPKHGSIFLHDFVSARTITDSIQAVAETWEAEATLPPALRSFLLRERPRLSGYEDGPVLPEGMDVIDGTLAAVQAMDGGTLVIQGPPGSGKTHVGSAVIEALVSDGKNVGVVSNGHKVVLNLLDACRKRSEEAGHAFECLKVGGDDDPLFQHDGVRFVKTGGDGAAAYGGGLIGGTAWLFSRDDMRGRLDYLFVDEAGQVSAANLVAMAPSTRNIVLLGDQMQLPQPLQGTHPGHSGESALEYVLGDRATVPDDLGIFLPLTWRLHPGICSFISGAVYEDRLEPASHTAKRVVRVPASGGGLVPIEAGVLFSPVEHEGNRQASKEEVERIVALVDALTGRTRVDEDGTHVVSIDDILFVAPFNMQVRRIERAIPGANAASVDKFQGQEAPIVIVSLCTSFGERGPRGLDFVLDKNRSNVAISRAQSLAIVVGDPRLALAAVTSVSMMERQNLLCRLIDAGTPRPVE